MANSTDRGLPSNVVALQEERDFCLRSLRDLEAELAAGDLDQADYDVLRDSYVARAAAALRKLDGRGADGGAGPAGGAGSGAVVGPAAGARSGAVAGPAAGDASARSAAGDAESEAATRSAAGDGSATPAATSSAAADGSATPASTTSAAANGSATPPAGAGSEAAATPAGPAGAREPVLGAPPDTAADVVPPAPLDAAADPVGPAPLDVAADPVPPALLDAAADPDGPEADGTVASTSGTRARWPRRLLIGTGVLMVAAGAAWAVAASSGTRLPGQEITGQAVGSQAEVEHLQQAQQAADRGDGVSALKEYQKVLNSDPNQPEALTGAGWILAQTQQPTLLQQGLSMLAAAEQAAPIYAPAHLYRGISLLSEGDYTGAIPELQWYLAHNPDPQLAPRVRTALEQAQAKAKAAAKPAG